LRLLLTAEPVTVLPEQREVLEKLVRTHSTPQQVALRPHHLTCGRAQERTRARCLAEDGAVLAQAKKSSDSERPISQWSQRKIADEAIRRGLAPNIAALGGRRRRRQYQDGKGFHAVSPLPAQQCRIHDKAGHYLRQSQHPPF
jgi:hypothetical protein